MSTLFDYIHAPVTERFSGELTGVKAHSTSFPHAELTLLFDLVKQHATVAAMPDGEDSTGRQQLRLQTPEELVERCRQIVHHVQRVAREDGWVEQRPAHLLNLLTEQGQLDTLAGEQAAAKKNDKLVPEPAT